MLAIESLATYPQSMFSWITVDFQIHWGVRSCMVKQSLKQMLSSSF